MTNGTDKELNNTQASEVVNGAEPVELGSPIPILYETLYKKGNLKGELRFYHAGPLESAVQRVKNYLERKNLKHLHTMPFVVDLNNANLEEQQRMAQ